MRRKWAAIAAQILRISHFLRITTASRAGSLAVGDMCLVKFRGFPGAIILILFLA